LFGQADEKHGHDSVFNCATKLNAILIKCHLRTRDGAAEAIWLVEALCDLMTYGEVEPAELSYRMLTGAGAGRRGVLDLLLYKKSILRHLVAETVLQMGMTQDEVRKFQLVFFDFASFRAAHVQSVEWSPAATELADFTATTIFRCTADASLRTAVSKGTSVSDWLAQQLDLRTSLHLLPLEVPVAAGMSGQLSEDGMTSHGFPWLLGAAWDDLSPEHLAIKEKHELLVNEVARRLVRVIDGRDSDSTSDT
jgi:hypothetical protein